MHPEAQAKAFEEIDRVIGQDRLPTLADLDNLPYMEALWKETLRWSPPCLSVSLQCIFMTDPR
jgi:cytochrome P450